MVSTRERALLVAAQIIAEEGQSALTVERVATAVGIKAASLYHHVSSRDELVREVLTSGVDAVTDAVRAALDEVPEGQALRRLETAVRAHVRAVEEGRPFTVAYVRTVDQWPPVLRRVLRQRQRRLVQLWSEAFDDAGDSGVFAAGARLDTIRTLVLAALSAAAADERGSGEALADELINLLRGAAALASPSTPDVVSVTMDGEVGRLRLVSPPVNALTHDVITGICVGIEELTRQGARAAVIDSGVADSFCGGADLALLRRLDPAGFESYLIALRSAFQRIAHAPFPTIAVVDGPAVGCGLELAIACTFRVASQRASFCLPEVSMGLNPGAGSTLRLPHLVGRQVALDLVLTGRTMDAAEAYSTGLVDRLEAVPTDAGAAWARQLSVAPSNTLLAAMRSVGADYLDGERSQAELHAAVDAFATPGARDGIESWAAGIVGTSALSDPQASPGGR